MFQQTVPGLLGKNFFAVLSKLQTTWPEKTLVVFRLERRSIPISFENLRQKIPAVVGKLQAVLSEKLVPLPEDFLEAKLFPNQINFCVSIFAQKNVKFWSDCFRHVCQNCLIRVYWKISRRIKNCIWKNQLSLLSRVWEEEVRSCGKKSLIRVDKTAFYLPERHFEKVDVFVGQKLFL